VEIYVGGRGKKGREKNPKKHPGSPPGKTPKGMAGVPAGKKIPGTVPGGYRDFAPDSVGIFGETPTQKKPRKKKKPKKTGAKGGGGGVVAGRGAKGGGGGGRSLTVGAGGALSSLFLGKKKTLSFQGDPGPGKNFLTAENNKKKKRKKKKNFFCVVGQVAGGWGGLSGGELFPRRGGGDPGLVRGEGRFFLFGKAKRGGGEKEKKKAEPKPGWACWGGGLGKQGGSFFPLAGGAWLYRGEGGGGTRGSEKPIFFVSLRSGIPGFPLHSGGGTRGGRGGTKKGRRGFTRFEKARFPFPRFSVFPKRVFFLGGKKKKKRFSVAKAFPSGILGNRGGPAPLCSGVSPPKRGEKQENKGKKTGGFAGGVGTD